MNIVLLDGDTLGKDISLQPIEQFGTLKVYGITPAHEIKSRIEKAEIVIVNKVNLGRNEIDLAPNLKLICVAATGTNNVDLEYASEKNIPVKNVSGYSTDSVAQTTFASLLNLRCHISYYDQYVKSCAYTTSPIFTHFTQEYNEIADKQFGIIGLGTIGKKVAQIATAFGARVVYCSSTKKNKKNEYLRMELGELLKTSDIVSIHCSLNDSTKNLITEKELKTMKPSALLLNLSRGGIVNEKDIVKALDEKWIAGAAFDVYEQEPMPPNHPFYRIKDKSKFILTPHLAWASTEARKKLVDGIAKNIETFINCGK